MDRTISRWQLYMHCSWRIGKVIAPGLRCNSQRGSTTRFHVIRDYNDSLSEIGSKLNIGSQYCLLHITRDPGEWVLPIMTYKKRLRPKGVPVSRFRFMKG